MTVGAWLTQVAKEAGEFVTTQEEEERARRWAWWRRAISEEREAPAPESCDGESDHIDDVLDR